MFQSLKNRAFDIKDPDTQRKLRQILSRPCELGSLDTTNLGQEEREVVQLMARHFSLLIDATNMMRGKNPEVKGHSFELANLRMIEDLARSVENGLRAWEKTVLAEHDLCRAVDAFRLQPLTVLNEKSIEDVREYIDAALVEDFNTAGAITFSDLRWYLWS